MWSSGFFKYAFEIIIKEKRGLDLSSSDTDKTTIKICKSEPQFKDSDNVSIIVGIGYLQA